MPTQIWTIARNTFTESIRQPIFVVILIAATVLLAMNLGLSAYTLSDDNKLLIDMGLSTMFLGGLFLAAFTATGVLSREIDNKTALTVISKPIGRPLFIIGKYLGVALALLVATGFLALVFLLVENHGVIQTARDPVHLPVVVFGVGAGIIGVGTAVWCNYFYNMAFTSTVICITTPLAAIAYCLSLLFDHGFNTQPITIDFDPQLWLALAAMMVAVLVLIAVAIAASTRFGQAMTLVITLGIFMLGMLSDWFFGRQINRLRDTWLGRAREQGMTEQQTVINEIHEVATGEITQVERTVEVATQPLWEFADAGEKVFYSLCQTAYSIVPNFQVMLLSDALTQGHKIPPAYVAQSALYGVLLIVGLLALAIAMFQRREVG